MNDARLLLRIQYPPGINALLQIHLRPLTQFIILHSHPPDEPKVALKSLRVAVLLVVIVKLHARHPGAIGRADPEGGHAAAVDVEGADGEEVEEEAVLWILGVGDVAGVIAEIVDFVEGGGINLGEGSVCVLAVEAFLISIYPFDFQKRKRRRKRC